MGHMPPIRLPYHVSIKFNSGYCNFLFSIYKQKQSYEFQLKENENRRKYCIDLTLHELRTVAERFDTSWNGILPRSRSQVNSTHTKDSKQKYYSKEVTTFRDNHPEVVCVTSNLISLPPHTKKVKFYVCSLFNFLALLVQLLAH